MLVIGAYGNNRRGRFNKCSEPIFFIGMNGFVSHYCRDLSFDVYKPRTVRIGIRVHACSSYVVRTLGDVFDEQFMRTVRAVCHECQTMFDAFQRAELAVVRKFAALDRTGKK